MSKYNYVIIGGGMTAASAVKGIRAEDSDGSIGLISRALHPPYDRPPLSKGLWHEKPIEEIWRQTPEYDDVALHLGRNIVRLDLNQKQAIDDEDGIYTFDKLLLATGGKPRLLPITPNGADDARVIYFRGIEDYWKLRDLTQQAKRFAVIGGGFIGAELAAALTTIENDLEIVMIFPEDNVGAGRFPRDLATFITQYYQAQGINVRNHSKITGMDLTDEEIMLTVNNSEQTEQEELAVDAVIVGIGIEPNDELAERSGLQVADGIMVDRHLQTNHPAVYAAGDVARFYNDKLATWMRVEHADNANTMGKIAGKNMAEAEIVYDHIPFFYSDLFDYGYEAVGELDAANLETRVEWDDPNEKGVIYYLNDESEVRGVLLWNVWGELDAARDLIGEAFKPRETIPLGN